ESTRRVPGTFHRLALVEQNPARAVARLGGLREHQPGRRIACKTSRCQVDRHRSAYTDSRESLHCVRTIISSTPCRTNGAAVAPRKKPEMDRAMLASSSR